MTINERNEMLKTINVKHGESRSKLYSVWINMKARCYNKNSPNYQNYGAKGVSICEEWLNSFESFQEWAMENDYKEGLFLDKDIRPFLDEREGNVYSPENCMFVTRIENNLLKTAKGFNLRTRGKINRYEVYFKSEYVGTYLTIKEATDEYVKYKRKWIRNYFKKAKDESDS